jgi:hypothetical protein
MLFAQSLGEYGGFGSIIARLTTAFDAAAQWLQLSLREDRGVWIAVAVTIVVGAWLFRRR